MSTAPAGCEGLTAVIRLKESTEKVLAGTSPNMTFCVPKVKPRPVIVTLVPPAVGPEEGKTAVISGAGPDSVTLATKAWLEPVLLPAELGWNASAVVGKSKEKVVPIT